MLQYVNDNLAVMSVGFLLKGPEDAVIWRGPRKNGQLDLLACLVKIMLLLERRGGGGGGGNAHALIHICTRGWVGGWGVCGCECPLVCACVQDGTLCAPRVKKSCLYFRFDFMLVLLSCLCV